MWGYTAVAGLAIFAALLFGAIAFGTDRSMSGAFFALFLGCLFGYDASRTRLAIQWVDENDGWPQKRASATSAA
jgi:uncharacterized membrane protein YjjP (DUF1212 family)